MSAPASYQYTRLSPGEVRYLSLYPGVDNEPLRCSLHTAPLTEATFEAVSYVWGSDVKDQQIDCDGYVLQITTNVFKVLQRVRNLHNSRHLWADMICINQEDLDEKGQQVAIMGQIYRRAICVLIMMGSDDHGHGPHVLSLVHDVCRDIDQTLQWISLDWNTFPHLMQELPILTDTRWASMRLLLGENWFERGWVVREAGFAQSALVIWGSSEFSWHSLMRTICWLNNRAVKTLYGQGLDDRIPLAHLEVFEDRNPTFAKLFTTSMTWVDQSLLGYLSLTRALKLKDPRDRIYAFLELVEIEERRFHFRPNYNDHFLHVYQQFAAEYIQSVGDLGLLSNVEHDGESLKSGIPSWVPRWDLTLTRSGYHFAPADSGFPPLTSRDRTVRQPTIIGGTVLKSRGTIIDNVLYASQALSSSTTTLGVISEIWRSIEVLNKASPYPTMDRLTFFIGVLTAGTGEGDSETWWQSEAAYYREIYESSQKSNTIIPPHSTDLFHNTVKGYTHNRKIILTERGYVGLAPAVTKDGDSCGILFGCTTPSILRPVTATSSFLYIGAAYVVGQQSFITEDGREYYLKILGDSDSKDWTQWDVEEQDIYLC